jgi:CelD/BcsL family acetyltransferase involved in cellulose biosynthesis
MAFNEDRSGARPDDKVMVPVTTHIVDPLAVTPKLAAAWDRLALDASEPNPFAERWCLQSALHLLDPERQARLLMVREGVDGPIIGVMPLASATRYGHLPLRHIIGWAHPNHFHGAPLVRAGSERLFWTALLDWCDAVPWGGTLLQLTHQTEGGPLHRALAEVAQARGGEALTVHREERALLESDLSPTSYWKEAVRAKKRKEIRRRAKRLADLGAVQFRNWQAGEDIAPWIATFLTLESQGWKGRAGSALASSSDTEAWFRAIMAGAAENSRLDLCALYLDERPLGMLISFLCPPGGFGFKTAYDEEFARFSPGVMLQEAYLEILNNAQIAWCDSCAAPDHPMIDSIWRERRALVWVNVPLSGAANRFRFAALTYAERLWRRWKAAKAKSLPLETHENDQ